MQEHADEANAFMGFLLAGGLATFLSFTYSVFHLAGKYLVKIFAIVLSFIMAGGIVVAILAALGIGVWHYFK